MNKNKILNVCVIPCFEMCFDVISNIFRFLTFNELENHFTNSKY